MLIKTYSSRAVAICQLLKTSRKNLPRQTLLRMTMMMKMKTTSGCGIGEILQILTFENLILFTAKKYGYPGELPEELEHTASSRCKCVCVCVSFRMIFMYIALIILVLIVVVIQFAGFQLHDILDGWLRRPGDNYRWPLPMSLRMRTWISRSVSTQACFFYTGTMKNKKFRQQHISSMLNLIGSLLSHKAFPDSRLLKCLLPLVPNFDLRIYRTCILGIDAGNGVSHNQSRLFVSNIPKTRISLPEHARATFLLDF